MKKLLIVPALLLSFVAAPALAQTAPTASQAQTSPLQMVLNDFAVTTVRGADGQSTERLNPDATRAQPGAIIQYELVAKNVSRAPLADVRPTLPVPAGTVYVASSGGIGNVTTEYSFDGGKTFGQAPLFKTVTVEENGKSVTKRVQVQPSEYTNVRWNVGTMRPDQSHKMTVRVRVR